MYFSKYKFKFNSFQSPDNGPPIQNHLMILYFRMSDDEHSKDSTDVSRDAVKMLVTDHPLDDKELLADFTCKSEAFGDDPEKTGTVQNTAERERESRF